MDLEKLKKRRDEIENYNKNLLEKIKNLEDLKEKLSIQYYINSGILNEIKYWINDIENVKVEDRKVE